ncbi:MAG: hypothetical protein AAF481_02280 [Acidobacteriota bacterium]
MNQISKRCAMAFFFVLVVAGMTGCATAATAASDEPEAAVQSAPSSAAPNLHPRPDWVKEHWRGLIGNWITDNSEHKSESEPLDAYGLEWSWGIGEQSLIGRLYGLQEGKEVWTFWQFREYWDPLEGRLALLQFGWDGPLGTGFTRRTDDGMMESVQTFVSAAADSASRIGHRSTVEGDEQETRSFKIDEAGNWNLDRTHLWRRQPMAEGAAGEGKAEAGAP